MSAPLSGVTLMADSEGEPMVRLRRTGHVARLDLEEAALLVSVLAQVRAHHAAVLLSVFGPAHDVAAVEHLERRLFEVLGDVRLGSDGYVSAREAQPEGPR